MWGPYDSPKVFFILTEEANEEFLWIKEHLLILSTPEAF